jgi:hypothetical protein
MTKLTGMEPTLTPTEPFMRETGSWINSMDRAEKSGLMVLSTKDSSQTDIRKGEESLSSQMDRSTKENSARTKSTDTETTSGRTARPTSGPGSATK